ncbi:MAG: hypothetical protein IT529_08860 [Burkholderiales bacterium]|nr:hypothetical protein [Burkholderiales bacterium]
MKPASRIAIAAAALVLGAAAVSAQTAGGGPGMEHDHGAAGHGPMMRQGMGPGMGRGPAGMLTARDASSAADMGVTMNLDHDNTKIRRTVTRLPDRIRTVSESDDPAIAGSIKAHVASMSQRLKDGREFNIFSTTLPVIFDNAGNIKSVVEFTDKGAIVTRTSTDPSRKETRNDTIQVPRPAADRAERRAVEHGLGDGAGAAHPRSRLR